MFVPASVPNFGKALPRVTPESVGIPSGAIACFLKAAEEKRCLLHSFVLVRDDKVCAEGYFAPYHPHQLQTVYSLSKSFTSAAIGIAAGEGILNLDERIVDIFADELDEEPCAELQALTLRHCLRMSTGQPREDPASDKIKAFLKVPFTDMPGEVFRYNTMATYMLSAALFKRGVDLEEYLNEKLFTPMGVSGLHWMRCDRGIPVGGYGLSILPEVIAKFGILVKNNGVWEGKQLIPKDYLDLATSMQIDNSANNAGEWAHGYGYKFWMCRDDAFRGDGAFGQLCIVSRKKNAVLAVTAHTDDMQTEMDVCFEELFDAMEDAPLDDHPASHGTLCARLAALQSYSGPIPDDGAAFPASLLENAVTVRFGGEQKAVDVGPKVMVSETEQSLLQATFEETPDGLRFTCTGMGSFLLDRAAFRDQVTVCKNDPLHFGPTAMESRVLAGYGVKNDGTVCVRLNMLELLHDLLIEFIPQGGSWRVRASEAHLPHSQPVVFDTEA